MLLNFNKLLLISTFSSLIFALPSFAEKKRIAVLPFEVLTERADLKQFGIGTSDSITFSLNNVPEFIMIDRGQLQSVIKEQAFQNSNFVDKVSSVKLGKLLGAEVLVIGSIQMFGDQFRVNSRLTEVKTGKILKTSQVTGANIFDLQDKIAQEIAKFENIKLTVEQKTEIKKITQSTSNINAYDLYTQGRSAYLEFTREGY